MIRRVTFGTLLCLLVGVPPTKLCAQFNPYVPAAESNSDPRVRRANRERAVAAVGPVARNFVEALGDEAVAAVFAVSKPVAEKLAEFHAAGELGKLPRPKDLLRTIALPGHGDDVAMWAIQHAGELADTDNFDAYLQNPLDYALGLKALAAGAAEVRVRRLSRPPVGAAPAAMALPGEPMPLDTKLGIIGCVGTVILFAYALWQRRKSRIC